MPLRLGDISDRLRGAYRRGRDRARVVAAFVWRRLMLRTTVVAITGSVGKSTTKECLAAILSAHGPTLKTQDNRNDATGVPRTLLRLRPWHRYAVIEVGTEVPGRIARSARLVKPHVAIVLAVAGTHSNHFPTLEDTAAEKATLLDHLARGGTAILNGDDARVRAMADRVRAKVVIVGRTGDCDLRAEGVRASWPDRLAFTAADESGAVAVHTQLVGAHWLGAALASLAAARACGVPLSAAADRLRDVPPFAGRLQPVTLPSGAVVIRDEENGSVDTVDAMLEVMRTARAERTVLVFSDIQDVKRNAKKRLRDIGRIAAEVADVAVFVGEHAHHGVRGAIAAGMDPACCHEVIRLERAAELLASELRSGDLVFVKGRATDHLSRIVFAQFGPIGCWTRSCNRRPLCDVCDQLRPGFDLQRALAGATPARSASA
jgi:UDP-N-acetylmuramoyl-tripeptide--D-alanyl-D-alanine ligase